MNYDIAKLPLSAQQRLLGDGVNLTCVVAWWLYCFSHLARREVVQITRFPVDFGLRDENDDDEEDDL